MPKLEKLNLTYNNSFSKHLRNSYTFLNKQATQRQRRCSVNRQKWLAEYNLFSEKNPGKLNELKFADYIFLIHNKAKCTESISIQNRNYKKI